MQFRVVVPVYNSARWIGKCINSIKMQRQPFKCMIIDDCSTDSTKDIITKSISKDNRFQLIESDKRVGSPLANIVRGTRTLCKHDGQDVVIVNVDGDDWFHSANTLTRVANAYKTKLYGSGYPVSVQGHYPYMTYGGMVKWPDEPKIWSCPLYSGNDHANATYRKRKWFATHLRTYKKFLFDSIPENYLKFTDGQYYKMAGDLALMFALLERSGGRAVCTRFKTYVYNRSNPLNEDKVNVDNKGKYSEHIRNRTPLPPI